MQNAVVNQLTASGEQITLYNSAEHQTPEAQQALLLNQAVTDALAAHVVFMDITTFAGRLPHQAAQPETYTLAEAVQALAPGSDADYALFTT